MITQKELKEILHYNPKTGLFMWAIKKSTHADIGGIAGSLSKCSKYMQIRINGKLYYGHRLAWLYMYGSFPINEIDHINQNRSDNRMANLRAVTHKENLRNQPKRSTNTSGVTGVYWSKALNKWMASICVEGKSLYLGYFINKFEAICARKSAEAKHGFHKNHGLINV